MSIPVWLLAFALSIVNGFASDKVQRRRPFFIIPLFFSVIGYASLIAQVHITVGVRYMAVLFLIGGCFAAIAVRLTWMNNNILGKKKRGIACAAVLGVGNCGSILGSNVFLSSEAPQYLTGYSVSLASIILAQMCAVAYLFYLMYENKARAEGRRDRLRSLPQSEQDDLGDKHPSYRYVY